MTQKKPYILWIDDDEELLDLVSVYLVSEGFIVDGCLDAEAGVIKAMKGSYDLILLDIIFPSINGLHLLKIIKSCTQTPVIMLTGTQIKESEVQSLNIGADDYISKPFDLKVLLTRINLALKRNRKISQNPKLVFHALTVNTATREAYLSDTLLLLTNTEFELLKMLMLAHEQGVTKQALSTHALGKKMGTHDRSLDTHITNLRKKLKAADTTQAIEIKTIYGFGYMLKKNE